MSVTSIEDTDVLAQHNKGINLTAGHAPCWLIGTTTDRKDTGKVRARPARRLSRTL